MRFKSIGFFWLLFLFLACGVFAGEGPHVEIFSPQGTVKGVRQVSVRFSEQMVPFGDPRGLIEPFDIFCSVGTGFMILNKISLRGFGVNFA